jgi:hypothetical protein
MLLPQENEGGVWRRAVMVVDFTPNGYTVELSEDDIDAFSSVWPCCKLVGLRGVTFSFDSKGDLVDVDYRNGSSDDWDGSELLALSQDAQEFAQGTSTFESSGFAKR